MSDPKRDSGSDDSGRDSKRSSRGTPSRRSVPVPPGRPFRQLAFWVLVIMLSVVAYKMYQGSFMTPQRLEVSYTRFIQEVDKGNILDLQIIERSVTGDLKTESSVKIANHDTPFKMFKTNIVGDGAELPDRVWKTNPGVEIEVHNAGFSWVSMLLTWLPLILIFGAWLFVLRQMQAGGSAAMKFGKTKARVLIESQPKITFKDVAGCDEAKQELQEIIEFLKEPQKFQKLGARIPKGALLLGPPGTGKTLLAKAVAGEAGVPFFSMSGSDFVEMFVGVGASVTGDTPILIRSEGRTRLLPIGEFVDGFYQDGKADFIVPVEGVETLGFEELGSKFKGSSKTFVRGSGWKTARGVYRHRVSEIHEIRYLGGTLRTTGDHSVFVRTRDGIKSVPARELEAGDVLVQLPALADQPNLVGSGSRSGSSAAAASSFASAVAAMEVAPSPFESDLSETVVNTWNESLAGEPGTLGDAAFTVQSVEVKPYDGFVYDLCGCDNEAFFGGEKPVLLHNSRVRDLFEQGKRNAPCITGDAVVTLTGGRQVTIAEMFDEQMVGVKVPAMTEDFRFEDATVIGITRKPNTELLTITTATSEIRATGNHLFPVMRGEGMRWVRADELTTSDYVAAPRDLDTSHAPRNPLHARLPLENGQHSFESTLAASTQATSQAVVEETDERRGSVLWSKITNIVKTPSNELVYDLCLDRVNCFIANNLVVHNCIVFIDEIDAVGRHRGAGLGGGHDEREQTLNQLLVEMDGFESNDGVIIVAATNRPDVLDPALLRPGRFDRQIVVDWPDVRGREGILKVHAKKRPLADDVDLNAIARGTPGMSGADLENLVNEAALLAARRNRKKVLMIDFGDAKDKVMLGMERKSLVMSQPEREATAYHEAGHALVGWLTPGSDPVNKVTIIPRGRALGITSYLPSEERYARSKEDLERVLCMMMGGRAAEYLIFNHLTTGASNDLERATALARKMVCELGMSENLGPLTFGKKEEMVFLGREIASHKDYSETTAQMIDKEVRTIVEGAYNKALDLLRNNLDKLHLLAKSLLEREVLDGDEMGRLLKGETLPPITPAEQEPAERVASTSEPPSEPQGNVGGLGPLTPPAPRPAGA